MGRGRQKAKQMKVARRLKYFSPETDLEALQRELSTDSTNTDLPGATADQYEDDSYSDDSYDDPYADKYADKYQDLYADDYQDEDSD